MSNTQTGSRVNSQTTNGSNNNTSPNGSQQRTYEDVLRVRGGLEAILAEATANLAKATTPEGKKFYERKVAETRADIDKLVREFVPTAQGTPAERQPWYGEIVYQNGQGYHIKTEGVWAHGNVEDVKRRLRMLGISGQQDVDRAIETIRGRFNVEYVGPMTVLTEGIYGQEKVGIRALVTPSRKPLNLIPGDFLTIEKILDGLLGEERVYFDAWCKTAYEDMLEYRPTGKNSPGHVLILVGPRHCGKSLLQYHIIKPLLGGGEVRPYQYMSGETTFNGDWVDSANHMIEDEIAAKDKDRVDNYFKKSCANQGLEIHPKGKKAVSLNLFFRVSVTANDNASSLSVLPWMEDHLVDKIDLLKCAKFELPMPANSSKEKRAFEEQIAKELSHYIHWLVNSFEIPADIVEGGRGGYKAYQSPEVRKAMAANSKESQLWELIQMTYGRQRGLNGTTYYFRKPASDGWVEMGTPTRVLEDVGSEHGYALRIITKSLVWLGRYLGRLTEMHPDNIQMRETTKGSIYYFRPIKK
jgi:hypothetical protein